MNQFSGFLNPRGLCKPGFCKVGIPASGLHTDYTESIIYRARNLPSDVSPDDAFLPSASGGAAANGDTRRASMAVLNIFQDLAEVAQQPHISEDRELLAAKQQQFEVDVVNYRRCARGLYHYTLEDHVDMMLEEGATEALHYLVMNAEGDAEVTRYCAAAYCNLSSDPECRVVVLSGAGRMFSAGWSMSR